MKALGGVIATTGRRMRRPLEQARCFSTKAATSGPSSPDESVHQVHVEINGQPLSVPSYSTILEAARAAEIFVPTLCAHPSIRARGLCRVCLVEIEGQSKLQPACVTAVKEGLKVRTNTPAVLESVRFVLQLLRAKHPDACATCDANNNCTFQDLIYRFEVENIAPPGVRKRFVHSHEWAGCPLVGKAVDSQEELKRDEAYNAIWLDEDKCVKCGRCVAVCKEVQGIGAIGFVGRGDKEQVSTLEGLSLDRTKCIECGQCAAICPTGAMRERHDIFNVFDALEDKTKVKVACIAPSVRVAMSEEFGLAPGAVRVEQMVQGLRALGFDAVFDTNFTADLTIMEEGSELLARLGGAGPLPMFTSCCPGWVNLVEKSYPELIPHLSSCKSPQGMMGALVKNMYAQRRGLDPSDVVCVSVMPCTAKKDEAHRPDDRFKTLSAKLGTTVPNNDYVLTTRELGRMFRLRKIPVPSLDGMPPDDPLGEGTGAAVLFGATGGVMEAALRTAYELASGQPLPKLDFEAVRGLDGVKSAVIKIPAKGGGEPKEVRVGVVHGTAQTRELLEKIKKGEEKFDFVEVMACRGGCIGGGGQSKSDDPLILSKRMAKVYDLDERSVVRKSHENPSVQKVYAEFLGQPLGHKSHELLHTHYTDRSKETR